MKREHVAFYSERCRLSGQLCLPDDREDGERRPAVVLAHGFTGVKELSLPAYAERFAGQGRVAMTFDYRGFGTSEGQPGRLVALEEVEDICNAVTCVCTRSEADPLAAMS
jgi:fermentation-respiration switch protein FrsA (DUF1100 family)